MSLAFLRDAVCEGLSLTWGIVSKGDEPSRIPLKGGQVQLQLGRLKAFLYNDPLCKTIGALLYRQDKGVCPSSVGPFSRDSFVFGKHSELVLME